MMPEITRTRVVVVLAVLASWTMSGTARAQLRVEPISVHVEDLLGGDCPRTWGTVHVTVTNGTSDRVTGDLAIVLRNPAHEDLVQPMTLEPRATGSAVLVVPPNWCSVQACFRAEGRPERCSDVGTEWLTERGDRNGEVLVLQRDLELRPALSVAGVSEERRDGTYSYDYRQTGTEPGVVRPPLVTYFGVGDPGDALLLPDEPVAYHNIRMVLAEAAQLERLDEGQRRALGLWVRTGGELTVVARNAREIGEVEIVRELVPEFAAGDGLVPVVLSPGLQAVHRFVDLESEADGVLDRGPFVHRAPGLEVTTYGTRVFVGLGTVHFVQVDRSVEGAVERASTDARSAVHDLLAWNRRFRTAGWQTVNVEYGARGELPQYGPRTESTNEQEAARLLQLDPNLNSRLPLWAYLLVVVGFTVALFLMQRRWVRRGGNVWRMVGASTVIALAGCLLVFALAWAVRGPGARYRAMAWIEAGSGSHYGVIWRRLALATDAPGARTFPLQPGLMALAPDGRVDLERRTLRIETSRWETVIAAEHGVVELEGAAELLWGEGDGPVGVRNTFDRPLRDAVLVSHGQRTFLGDLDAGEEAAVDYQRGAGSLPLFIPDEIVRRTEDFPGVAALVAGLDTGCPDRGDFMAQRCTTTLVVWGRP